MSFIMAGIAAVQVVGGVVQVAQSESTRRKAESKQQEAQKKLESLERNRQPIVNPYENVTDLSGLLSNPMANLGVATQAAEMQAEQADISLANTLDTLRATGASAGGATALAQAALQSKKGVSASIEKQEAQNEQLKAQGEQTLQNQRMAEAQRMQAVDASSREFMYQEQETRELRQLDRTQNMMDNAEAQRLQAIADRNAAITSTIGALGNFAGAVAPMPGVNPGDTGGAVNTGGTGGAGGIVSTGGTGGSGYFDIPYVRPSDRRLKTNINKIGVSPRGFNIYTFEYKNEKHGKGVYQGVMSDEVPSKNVVKDNLGYDMVNYSNLDVEFKKVNYEL